MAQVIWSKSLRHVKLFYTSNQKLSSVSLSSVKPHRPSQVLHYDELNSLFNTFWSHFSCYNPQHTHMLSEIYNSNSLGRVVVVWQWLFCNWLCWSSPRIVSPDKYWKHRIWQKETTVFSGKFGIKVNTTLPLASHC